MKLQGKLVRVEPNGFGVVKLDNAGDLVGVFTGRDRAPDQPASAFQPGASITADADEQHGNLQYLQNVAVA